MKSKRSFAFRQEDGWVGELSVAIEAIKHSIWKKLAVRLEESSKAEAKFRQTQSKKICRLIRTRQSNLRAQFSAAVKLVQMAEQSDCWNALKFV